MAAVSVDLTGKERRAVKVSVHLCGGRSDHRLLPVAAKEEHGVTHTVPQMKTLVDRFTKQSDCEKEIQ